jgi:hypothetical protein
MLRPLAAAASIALACTLALAGCGTKPPRQVEAPDALQDKGADMSNGQEPSHDVSGGADAKAGTQKLQEKCCGECKASLAKDRSGGKPETIPCTDYTDGLDPICLEYFRGKKTMAAECK